MEPGSLLCGLTLGLLMFVGGGGAAWWFLRQMDATERAGRARSHAAFSTLQDEGWVRVGDRPLHLRTPPDAPVAIEVKRTWIHGVDGGQRPFIEARVSGAAPEGRIDLQSAGELRSDVRVGAARFDSVAFLQLSPDDVPRFGHRFQDVFLELRGAGLEPHVEDRDVVVRARGASTSADRLHHLTAGVQRLAEAVHTGPLHEVLAHEARADGAAPGFRARCLQQLWGVDPALQRRVAADVAACGVAEVEIAAALLLGEVDPLRAHLFDPKTRGPLRLKALRGLLEYPEAIDALVGRVSELPDPLLLAALHELGDPDWPEGASLPATAVQTHVVPLLDHDDAAVVIAAARLLGRCGSVAAVGALDARLEAARITDRGIVTACRQAIAAIQSRATGTPGDLALAAPAPDRGALSEADAARRRGALSEES